MIIKCLFWLIVWSFLCVLRVMYVQLLQFLILLSVAFLLIMMAQRLKISYPIFLVLAGLGISYLPGIPQVSIDPEIIFFLILPPLLYDAAWYTSLKDFWKWKRPISLLAIGLVIVTSSGVAIFSYFHIPGFTLALGFLLGGIVSPPDATASNSILKNVIAPQRVTTILEGESLVNDASGLIVMRFALMAVLTGNFSLNDAISEFLFSTFGGALLGLSIALIIFLYISFCLQPQVLIRPSR